MTSDEGNQQQPSGQQLRQQVAEQQQQPSEGGYRPYGLNWGPPEEGGQQQPYGAGQGDSTEGGYRPYGMNWGTDSSGQQQTAQPSGAQAQQAYGGTAWYANPSDQGGFANTIEDLSKGGPMPTAPSLSDWEQLGPFGHAGLRYGLETAGYNWAPYSEAMLAGWRQTGQSDPNTGLSGWGAPHVTSLGLQSMSPMQAEDLRQTAELFSPWTDYLTRERRAWQTGLRPMSRIRA